LKVHGRKWYRFWHRLADRISGAVGTWHFVLLYTLSMITWIALHRMGILSVDTPGFDKWNMWLAWFAGIQASIVLMSTARQEAADRRKHDCAFQVDRDTHAMIRDMAEQITDLEEIIADLLREKSGGKS
jgi:uncharacterized membrane protein